MCQFWVQGLRAQSQLHTPQLCRHSACYDLDLVRAGAGVEELAVVVNDTLDLALALEVVDSQACKRTVDLQTVNEHTRGDHLERRHLLNDTLVESLVKSDGVLGLVLNAALGPLLLLAGLRRRGENGRLLRGHLA